MESPTSGSGGPPESGGPSRSTHSAGAPGPTESTPSARSAPSAEPFGPREFQLVLLRRMADHQPDLAEDARRALGASRTEMREANRRWQAWTRARRGPGELHRYRSALGEPESRHVVEAYSAEILRWPLPLWPDLRWEVAIGPIGRRTPTQVWGRGLVRAPGAPAPELRTEADLRPWSCTLAEVGNAFPPARPREGSAPTRLQLDFTLPDGTRRTAEFTWGLFQRLL
ncbi:hypothetical protein [Streptomyces sp. NPDC006551]|uniref:hypothetical protein n=1 Tax=Streptomyces sp. NPDC006551 TaxID=3157178 RepID=UPI0033B0E4B0